MAHNHTYSLRNIRHNHQYSLRPRTTRVDSDLLIHDLEYPSIRIPSLTLVDDVKCHRLNGLQTLTSRKMSFPFIRNNQLICTFPAKEDKRYEFSLLLSELLTSQERIEHIIPYINHWILKKSFPQTFYEEICQIIDEMKVKPISSFQVGDYCQYLDKSAELSFVQITAIHTNQSMFEVTATDFPVNQIIHLNVDPCVNRLSVNRALKPGAVRNKDLLLLVRKDLEGRNDNKWIKQKCLALIYRSLAEKSDAKYQNEKKLKKIVFKNKIKKMKGELKKIVIPKNEGSKMKIRIPAINKTEFDTIFKAMMKQIYGLVDWKETKASITLKLSMTSMTRLFGGACVKQTRTHKYGVDGCELKYVIKDKDVLLWVHITSQCKESGVIKGDVKSKKDREKAKAKRKREQKKRAMIFGCI
eukprot:131174_1